MSKDKQGSTSAKLQKLRNLDFINLEIKYQDWFNDKDTFIEEYFVDQDFSKGFVENCELPQEIKDDCQIIIARYQTGTADGRSGPFPGST